MSAIVIAKEAAARSAAEHLVSAGHKAIAVPCDVSDEAQVKSMVEQTVSAFGRLDAAFNNAGVGKASHSVVHSAYQTVGKTLL